MTIATSSITEEDEYGRYTIVCEVFDGLGVMFHPVNVRPTN